MREKGVSVEAQTRISHIEIGVLGIISQFARGTIKLNKKNYFLSVLFDGNSAWQLQVPIVQFTTRSIDFNYY